jgi:hypothetical protein
MNDIGVLRINAKFKRLTIIDDKNSHNDARLGFEQKALRRGMYPLQVYPE